MKIRTAISAGMTFEECDQVRNYWKYMAQSGPCNVQPTPPSPSPSPVPPTPPSPPNPNTGGGYINGVWYADKSGIC